MLWEKQSCCASPALQPQGCHGIQRNQHRMGSARGPEFQVFRLLVGSPRNTWHVIHSCTHRHTLPLDSLSICNSSRYPAVLRRSHAQGCCDPLLPWHAWGQGHVHGLQLDWAQTAYGSQWLYLLTKWPHPTAAVAKRLVILGKTHKTSVPSCAEQNLG